MKKEKYSIKRPEHIVIGDPWYFKTMDTEKLKNLVVDFRPPKEFVAEISIEETEYGESTLKMAFSNEQDINTYLDGYMYEGQKEEIKKIPVDTAEYSMEVDGRSSRIHTGEDGFWGQQTVFYYNGEADKRYIDAVLIIMSTPANMEFEKVKETMEHLFEDIKLIPEKDKGGKDAQKIENEQKR